MSVGKGSILRAANAGAKKNVKAGEKTTAKTTAKTTPKTTPKTATKTTVRKATVKESVISPQNAEKLEAVFITGEKKETDKKFVHINDDMPVHLL